jgi:hypothetical protein
MCCLVVNPGFEWVTWMRMALARLRMKCRIMDDSSLKRLSILKYILNP